MGLNVMEAKSTRDTFELPIGYLYQGKRYKQVLLTEITGEDEDTLASDRDAELKIAEVLSRRIQGFMEKEGPEHLTPAEALSLPVEDTDYIMVCLRRLSFGDLLKVKVVCPQSKCKYEDRVTVHLGKLEVKPFVEQSMHLKLASGTEVELRIATGQETQWMRKVAKRLKLTEDKIPVSLMMARFIAKLNGEVFSLDEVQGNKVIGWMQKLTMRERAEIRAYMESFKGSIDRTLEIECPSCGHNYKTPMEFGVDFFSLKE